MKKILIIFNLIFLSDLKSQESIQTDRPDQTESPAITPKKFLQIESGFLYEKDDSQLESLSYPTILWKYGFNENFEVRIITEFNSEKTETEKRSGIPPLTFGFKAKLTDEKKWIPKISFLGHITTNKLGSKDFQTTNIAPSFRFLFQHTISEKLNIGYNLGGEWNGGTPETTAIYTIAAAYSFTEKIGGFAEFYGFLNKYETPDHQFDMGFTYLINNDFQIDASSGFGFSPLAPDYFFSCGFSYRFPL